MRTLTPASGRLRTPLSSYRDYVTRNWPLWWNLRLGLPLTFAVLMGAMTSIFAMSIEVPDYAKISSTYEYLNLKSRQYYEWRRKKEAENQTNDASQDASEVPPLTISEVRQLGAARAERSRLNRSGDALLIIPLVVGSLFTCAWYFIVARSLKFPYAPRLGFQPRFWILATIGLLVLWSGLIGYKIFDYRVFQISWDSFSLYGGIGGAATHAKRPFGHTATLLIPWLNIATSFVFAAAVFTLLQRNLSLFAAYAGFVVILLGLGVVLLIPTALPSVSHPVGLEALIVRAWAAFVVACAAILAVRRNLRSMTAAAIGTLAYLLTLGPIAFVAANLDHIPGRAHFGRALGAQHFLTRTPEGYLVLVAVSVLACEVLFTIVNRLRIRPA